MKHTCKAAHESSSPGQTCGKECHFLLRTEVWAKRLHLLLGLKQSIFYLLKCHSLTLDFSLVWILLKAEQNCCQILYPTWDVSKKDYTRHPQTLSEVRRSAWKILGEEQKTVFQRNQSLQVQWDHKDHCLDSKEKQTTAEEGSGDSHCANSVRSRAWDPRELSCAVLSAPAYPCLAICSWLRRAQCSLSAG